jgi:hypothetical protein
MVNFYIMYPMFRKSIKSIAHAQPEVNQKAIQYYVKSLLNNFLYSTPNSIVARMLAEYSNSRGTIGVSISPEPFFNSLEVDPEKKLIIWHYIMVYYLTCSLTNGKIKDFAIIVPIIAEKLENQNLRSAWKQTSEMILLFIDLINNKQIDDKQTDSVRAIDILEMLERQIQSKSQIDSNKQRIITLTDQIESVLQNEQFSASKLLILS